MDDPAPLDGDPMTDCPHGMPTPSACIDCMDEGNIPPQKPEAEAVDYRFPARYEGTQCPACNLPVAVGELIAKMTTGRYLHDRCVS